MPGRSDSLSDEEFKAFYLTKLEFLLNGFSATLRATNSSRMSAKTALQAEIEAGASRHNMSETEMVALKKEMKGKLQRRGIDPETSGCIFKDSSMRTNPRKLFRMAAGFLRDHISESVIEDGVPGCVLAQCPKLRLPNGTETEYYFVELYFQTEYEWMKATHKDRIDLEGQNFPIGMCIAPFDHHERVELKRCSICPKMANHVFATKTDFLAHAQSNGHIVAVSRLEHQNVHRDNIDVLGKDAFFEHQEQFHYLELPEDLRANIPE
eukprot:224444_1